MRNHHVHFHAVAVTVAEQATVLAPMKAMLQDFRKLEKIAEILGSVRDEQERKAIVHFL